MRNVNNSVDTINAAATAIVSAESRVQPTTVQKRGWGSRLSLNWCFGCQKGSRIGNAVVLPEQVVSRSAHHAAATVPRPDAIVLPFVAPPSSPASFLQSDPSSSIQSPAGLLSLSANGYSPNETPSMFAVGPYANETQLVTPPVFSAFTTEPSTAPLTPHCESVQRTNPSSPEVPFAQLLTSSLERARRSNQKFTSSHYEFQSYQVYPGSPGGNLISPGSVVSNSGTSSPYTDKRPILELHMGEPPKFLGFELFTTGKWASQFDSGSLTPTGQGSGSPTRIDSRLGSGSLTPVETSRDGLLIESEVGIGSSYKQDELTVDHRVSFELTGEDVARCLESKSLTALNRSAVDDPIESQRYISPKDSRNYSGETVCHASDKSLVETDHQKHRSVSLGSSKEFKFDSTKGEILDKPSLSTEWWTNEKVVGEEDRPNNKWSFFPTLRSEVS